MTAGDKGLVEQRPAAARVNILRLHGAEARRILHTPHRIRGPAVPVTHPRCLPAHDPRTQSRPIRSCPLSRWSLHGTGRRRLGQDQVITQKIAHLIEDKGFEPRHIAAVTFTNKAAKEMQERIGKLMEGKTTREGKRLPLKQLTVCTFHSLGVQILRAEAEHVGLKPQFSIMDSDDCFGLVQEQLGTTDKKLIRSVQGTISLWKNGMVDPEAAIAQAADADQHRAALVYRNYVATLHAYRAVDFDDLIRLPAELFARDETVRLKWQNRLRYFGRRVPGHQCPPVPAALLLAGGSHLRAPAFTAVGDDDRAIYGWRGATLDNLRLLQTDFPT